MGALGTHKALGLAKDKGAIFMLASTSEVYGDPLVNPQPEDYWGNVNPIGPRGVYDEAKRFAEAMTMAYHRFHGGRASSASSTPTARACACNDGRAVPNFIIQASKISPSPSMARARRPAASATVWDLIEGIYRLIMSKYDYRSTSATRPK